AGVRTNPVARRDALPAGHGRRLSPSEPPGPRATPRGADAPGPAPRPPGGHAAEAREARPRSESKRADGEIRLPRGPAPRDARATRRGHRGGPPTADHRRDGIAGATQ